MAELPVADQQLISDCEAEYRRLSREGGSEAPQACFRLVWALVHSSRSRDNQRGLDLAEALLDSGQLDAAASRDLIFLIAVAQYQLGKYIDARRQIKELLKVNPDSRQAKVLQSAVEDAIVQQGLIGVGITVCAGAVGVAALVISALASRR